VRFGGAGIFALVGGLLLSPHNPKNNSRRTIIWIFNVLLYLCFLFNRPAYEAMVKA
jgi:hypothetical protein